MKIFSAASVGTISIASILGIVVSQVDQGNGAFANDGTYAMVAILSAIATLYFHPWLKEKNTSAKLIESQERITSLHKEMSNIVDKMNDAEADRKTMSDILSEMIRNNTDLISRLHVVIDSIVGADSSFKKSVESIDVSICDRLNSNKSGKILIVEDSIAARSPVVSLLELRRFSVDSAGKVSEAKSLIERNKYDFILLDLMLPDGDGEEILDLVVSSKYDVSVIITTAKTPEETAHLSKYGSVNIVRKPYKFFKEILPLLERSG